MIHFGSSLIAWQDNMSPILDPQLAKDTAQVCLDLRHELANRKKPVGDPITQASFAPPPL
jgi:hypothetical protein